MTSDLVPPEDGGPEWSGPHYTDWEWVSSKDDKRRRVHYGRSLLSSWVSYVEYEPVVVDTYRRRKDWLRVYPEHYVCELAVIPVRPIGDDSPPPIAPVRKVERKTEAWGYWEYETRTRPKYW